MVAGLLARVRFELVLCFFCLIFCISTRAFTYVLGSYTFELDDGDKLLLDTVLIFGIGGGPTFSAFIHTPALHSFCGRLDLFIGFICPDQRSEPAASCQRLRCFAGSSCRLFSSHAPH